MPSTSDEHQMRITLEFVADVHDRTLICQPYIDKFYRSFSCLVSLTNKANPLQRLASFTTNTIDHLSKIGIHLTNPRRPTVGPALI